MHSFLQRKGGLIAKGAALKKVVGMGGAYHKIEVPPLVVVAHLQLFVVE